MLIRGRDGHDRRRGQVWRSSIVCWRRGLTPLASLDHLVLRRKEKAIMRNYEDEPSIHDSLLTGYEVDGVAQRIVLHTEPFSGGGDAFIDVTFDGVAAYEFQNDLLQNIVFEVEEASLTETQEIANRIQAEEGRWGFPREWDPRRETVLECFTRLNVKVFQLGSSYGMTGWVTARAMSQVISFTPAHVPTPEPAMCNAIRQLLFRAWRGVIQADPSDLDCFIPGIHRLLRSGVDVQGMADYIARLQIAVARVSASADLREAVATDLIALHRAPAR